MNRIQTKEYYVKLFAETAKTKGASHTLLRHLAKTDLFFLLAYTLKRADVDQDWIFDRCREVEETPNSCLDLWARTHYKEHPLETDIWTSTGLKKFGDVHVGDYVFSPSGRQVQVLAETPVQQDPVQYKVKFVSTKNDEFEEIKAGSQHLWDVEQMKRTTWKDIYEQKQLSTSELFTYTEHQKTLKRKRWLRVPLAEPLRMPKSKVPINPYALGLWLGDGLSSCSSVVNYGGKLKLRVRRKLKGEIELIKAIKNTYVYCIKKLTPKLKTLGLEAVTAASKFIPEKYLRGSVEQRSELLLGLMDADSDISRTGETKFYSFSPVLAMQFKELITSLGGMPHESYQDPIIITTFNYNLIKNRLEKKRTNYDYWYIKDVQRIKSEPAKCIQVEGGKYLIGKKLIPTHNSTIITFGLTVQDILKNPDITVGIFSYTRPIAKAFLRQIKREFEENQELKGLFPEIFYDKPKTQAPKWSENDGIIVKRQSNPKESTVEAWGLAEGMPTSRHFSLRVYDDIITDTSVTTPEMIAKVTQAWELSQSLGVEGGHLRVVGTRYHFADTYSVIKKRKTLQVREYPATDNGKETGKPILLTRESLRTKRRDMGAYIFSCQLLLNPVADELQELKPAWLDTWPATQYNNMNIYILVDPAGEQKKTSDYSVFTVFGIGADGNYYIITWVRDKLNLTGKANVLFALHRQYRPLHVAYEKYGMQSDIEHFKDRMDRENYRFRITPVAGAVNKNDRIRKLVPALEQGRIFLPETCIRTDYLGKRQDLTRIFIEEEYKLFPYSPHDDMLDCMARIFDIRTEVPEMDMENVLGLNFNTHEARNEMVKRAFLQNQQEHIHDYGDLLTDGMRIH